MKMKKDNLNEEQRRCVMECVSKHKDIFMIHGPPGTGKTTTLIELISELNRSKKRVLVCSMSNTSIDNILQKLHDLDSDGL